MAHLGIANDLCPDLTELEKKIGRKTPESLLVSLRDHAADRDEALISDLDEKGDATIDNDSFSEKIKHLKGEMRCLRRADVQILCQLVAVHEGLEALRWLEEEQRGGGTPASGGSSLTGSQSSLGTAEGACWSSLSPSRTSPVPACSQDSGPGCSPPNGEPFVGVLSSPDGDTHQASNNQQRRSLPKPDLWTDEVGSARAPLGPKRGVRDSKWSGGRHDRTRALGTSPDPNPDPGPNPGPEPGSEPGPEPGPDLVCTRKHSLVSSLSPTTPRDFTNNNSLAVRRALDRSIKKRVPQAGSGAGSGGSGLTPTDLRGEAKIRGDAATERVQRNGGKRVAQDEPSALSAEKVLFGYDAQWFWVESQDDVTFL
ncbi:hypothetical protein NHX12_004019 [Muraenolepis orangiensis]|uniref:Leucine rich adaptor protein 1 n=1 Tax=Muraenolepis orangiensis TaxID=630683 RepID=A0A9Q0DUM3_9TELE|nr:hypothetical protein NHX12_004019 [Muraenolepis orangiensis]